MRGPISKETTNTSPGINLNADIVSFAFDLSKQVKEDLLDRKLQEDLRKKQELIKEYLDKSKKTLDSITALQKCLNLAGDYNQLLILVSEEETGSGEKRWSTLLQKLKSLKAADNPFTKEFFKMYKSVYNEVKDLLEKLNVRRSKLDKKVKKFSTWRIGSCVIVAVIVVVVLICAAVSSNFAAALAAASVAAADAVKAMRMWIEYLVKSENAVKEQQEVTISLEEELKVAINYLKNITVLVDQLNDEIKSLFQFVDFAIKEEASQVAKEEEIKKKLRVLLKKVEDLRVEADKCCQRIMVARNDILNKK